jgi:acyl-CoA hydrolase
LFEWGEAVSLATRLAPRIGTLAGKSAAAFSAIGDIGLGGVACVGSSVQAAGRASVSINVSVTASASFNSSAM